MATYWEGRALTNYITGINGPPADLAIERVQCPRCSGAGRERLFMHADTCEVCAGDGSVSPDTAKAEIARREEEIERWK